jgi:hypothetical protein
MAVEEFERLKALDLQRVPKDESAVRKTDAKTGKPEGKR